MANPFYTEYMKSDLWKATRSRILRRDGFKCARCGGRNKISVHHLNYDRLGRELDDDLETLCDGCHFKEHFHNHKWHRKPTRVPDGMRLGRREREALQRQQILDAVARGEHPSSPWPRPVVKIGLPGSKRQRRESRNQRHWYTLSFPRENRTPA